MISQPYAEELARQVDELEAENERLRKERDRLQSDLDVQLEGERNTTILECARVVEDLRTPFSEYNWAYHQAAAAIRALKSDASG